MKERIKSAWASMKKKPRTLAIVSALIVGALVAAVAVPVVATLPMFSSSSEDEDEMNHDDNGDNENNSDNGDNGYNDEAEIEIENENNIDIENENENENVNVIINEIELEIDLTAILIAIDDVKDRLIHIKGHLVEIIEKVDDIEQKLDHLELQTAVDLTYCSSRGTQCAGFDHTFEGAASTNHNPIRIAVLVTLHGAPVEGLGDADLVFENPFVPGGGGAAVEFNPPACGDICFQNTGGLYVFFVDREAPGFWTPGHYFATLTVTTPDGVSGTALIDWEIV